MHLNLMASIFLNNHRLFFPLFLNVHFPLSAQVNQSSLNKWSSIHITVLSDITDLTPC